MESDICLIDNTYTHVLDTGSPLQDGSSMNSLSSEPINSLNDDDLLIAGDLSEIPVDQSPLIHRRQSGGLPHARDSSLEYLSGNEPVWFPPAEDERNFDSYSYPEPGRVHHPYLEPEPGYKDKHGGSHKLAQRLKGMIQNLTGSSPNNHRKVCKTSSASIIQTSSTSALDRIKVGSALTSHALQSQRSKSTDLGRLKIKKDGQYSLEALTKVNSAENLMVPTINGRGYFLQKHRSEEDTHETSLEVDILSPVGIPRATSYSSSNISGSSQGLVPDLSRNLSEDSHTGSQTRLSAGGGGGARSYRTQRKKLHQTSSRTPKDAPTTPIMTTPTTATLTRRISNDESPFQHKTPAGRHGYQPHRPMRSSAHARPDVGSSKWSQGSGRGSVEDNMEMPSAFLSYDSQAPPKGSHDPMSDGQSKDGASLMVSMDTVTTPPHNQPHRPRSTAVSKVPARRAVSEQPPPTDYNEVGRDRVSSNDPRIVSYQ